MEITSFTKTGSYHSLLHKDNQDQTAYFETEKYSGIFLADGATGCSKGKLGASIACQTAAHIFETEGDTFFSYENKKTAFLLIEQILYNIERCMSPDDELKDYGSTLIGLCLQKKTGEALLFNLGDGAIIECSDGNYTSILGPKQYRDPKNPRYKGPCLTVTENAAVSMDLTRMDMPLESSIILGSDGFLNLFSKPEARLQLTEGLNNCDFLGINEVIDENELIDDSTYIALTRTRR